MGEGKKPFFEPTFNRSVKVRGGDDRLTSDAGSLLLREADERLDLTQSLAAKLYDRRKPEKIRYQMVELLRERLYAFAQGYDAQDDVDELAAGLRPSLAAMNCAMPSTPVSMRRLKAMRWSMP